MKFLISTSILDRKSTRLNSSHSQISYAVFCLKKKKNVRYIRHHYSVRGPSERQLQMPGSDLLGDLALPSFGADRLRHFRVQELDQAADAVLYTHCNCALSRIH